jgi:predicted enzyme related to lactoylglutathione lyase
MTRPPLTKGEIMQITASAVSLNVDHPEASADFVKRHFGFEKEMASDGFVSLSRPDAGFNLIYLRTGLPTFKPPAMAGHRADGLLLVFEVEDIDAEHNRLVREGVEITTPIETEEWGERFFQVTDPCGVVLQLVQWVRAAPQEATSDHNARPAQ